MSTRPSKPINEVGAPRTKGGGAPQKYTLDERGRRLINNLYDGTTERTDMIQREMPGIPRKIIQQWAGDMGKTKSRGHWTPKEEQYLRNNFAFMSQRKLQQALKKDRVTIQRKAAQLGLTGRQDPSHQTYTMTELMEVLGMQNDYTVRKWVTRGWLKGKKRKNADHQEVWDFRPKDIRDFIIGHPNEISPQKADWLWLVDILAGNEGVGNLLPDYASAEGGDD